MMTGIYFTLLILHILCCILTFAGIYTKLLDVHKYMFFVALFLPFWGVLTVLILHFQIAFNADDSREIQMEKMKLESEIYRSVMVDDRKNADSVIPIEEALVMNSAKQRRTLIMDVLNDNPEEYIEFLQKAGNNDDTEVVHYAVTAMVEISKENDYMLQQLERKYSMWPDDYDILTEYSDFLWNCLEQNLMQGQVEVMNRNHFNELIKKKLSVSENVQDYVRMVKNSMKTGNYTQAGETIGKMEAFCPDSEELFMLKLEYYALTERGDEIKKLIDKTENENRYLSAKSGQ